MTSGNGHTTTAGVRRTLNAFPSPGTRRTADAIRKRSRARATGMRFRRGGGLAILFQEIPRPSPARHRSRTCMALVDFLLHRPRALFVSLISAVATRRLQVFSGFFGRLCIGSCTVALDSSGPTSTLHTRGSALPVGFTAPRHRAGRALAANRTSSSQTSISSGRCRFIHPRRTFRLAFIHIPRSLIQQNKIVT